MDTWSALIGSAQGAADRVFALTEQLLEQTQVPNIAVERAQIAPGMLAGIFGTKRDFLVVSERGNGRLQPYRIYINARDYGTSLAVDWFLVYRPGFWATCLRLILLIPLVNILFLPFTMSTRLRTRGRGEQGGLDLDLFDQQDLRTYVTNAHRCLIGAVEQMMRQIDQDPSALERRSRGFLEIA